MKRQASITKEVMMDHFVHPSLLDKALHQQVTESNRRTLFCKSGNPAYSNRQEEQKPAGAKLPALDLSSLQNRRGKTAGWREDGEDADEDEDEIMVLSPTGLPIVHTARDWQHVRSKIVGSVKNNRKDGFATSRDRETEFQVLKASLRERRMEFAKTTVDSLRCGSEDRAELYKLKQRSMKITVCVA